MRGSTFAILASAMGIAAPLSAQQVADETASTAVSDEIVVTARKRSETLLEVPLAVTALSARDIEARGIRSLDELAAFAPGLDFQDQGSQRGGRSESVVRFRGMDINDVAPTRQLASVFEDGIYVSGGVASISMDDVERVEAIKGPQSALFGRSTFGGAVNFISRAPADELGMRASLLYGEGNTIDGSVSIEGPIFTDRLRARLTGRYYSTDGRYRSIADNGRLGEEETKSLNLIVDADPVDGLRLRGRVFLSEDNDGAPTSFALTRDLHNCGPFFPGGVTFFCGTLPRVENFGTNTVLTPDARAIFVDNSRNSIGIDRGPSLDRIGFRRQTQRYALSADIDISALDAVLTTTGSYNKLSQKRLLDLDFTPQSIWLESNFQDIEDWSGEVRLAGETGAVSWLAGFSLFDLRFETPNGSIGYLFPNPVFANGFFLNQTIADTKVRTIAGFGSMSWQFAQDWTLNLEARYQSDRLDQGIVNGRELATTFTNFLPRAILQWQPDRDTNLYLTYAKGNKPGDFNAAVVALNDAQKAEVQAQTGGGEIVDEERLDNFEFGIKKQFAGGLVSLNIATYYMKWKNQQTRTQATVTDLTIPAGVRAVPVIISAGSTDLYGIEAEGTARITRDVTFSGTFNWAGSRYKVFDCGFCARLTGTPDMSGNQSPRFPEITATMGLAYDRTLANDLGVFGRVDAIYNSGAFTEAFNFARNRDTARVNVRAGVQKDAWRLELFVINLFNNKDYISAARFTDFTKGNFNLNDFVVNVTPADPRQLGVRVRVQL